MNLDFTKLSSGITSDTILNPREIFTALPSKKTGKFQYPRDVQSQVWEKWFKRRTEKDLVLKMNTGSGKTTVGLIILKSCLNEKKGPAVYIAPDKYLVSQVIAEANDLGIEVSEDHNSARFQSGKAILVQPVQKLVNGKSVYGVGDEGSKIKIGTLLIDDAHACIDKIEDQFTISISVDNPAYSKIFNSLKDQLQTQCDSKVLEIESGDPYVYMSVPFWVWQEKIGDVNKLLLENKDHADLSFKWALLKDYLKFTRCVISAKQIEITPICLPIRVIPSIDNSVRRLFMTATLTDDSILSTHFGITDDSITQSINPETASDIGDRMIILPQLLNPEITDDEIKKFCKRLSKTLSVVVIVPSEYRSKYWSDSADRIINSLNINENIEQIKSQKVGLTVLINRYDGIDLPQDSCRLLVIDSLPDVRRLIDKTEQNYLSNTSFGITSIMQRIEQGMGRGIRSNDDYCVVILMGRTLTSKLYLSDALSLFSPGTRAQYEISDLLTNQLKKPTMNEVMGVMEYCLKQKSEWVTQSKGTLASLSFGSNAELNSLAVAQRKSFDCALIGNYNDAANLLHKEMEKISDLTSRGYLKQQVAEYINFYDKPEAQRLLKSAISDNPRLTKPLEGIYYHKLNSASEDQARLCGQFLSQRYDDPNKIIIEVNSIFENMKFGDIPANDFESAIEKIAMLIGFTSQRPEQYYKVGPDVLWSMGNLKYLVIECKNQIGADKLNDQSQLKTLKINKHDCNQLSGSSNWFISKYDMTCAHVPILIHVSNVFEHAATPKSTTRIINKDKLDLLKGNLLSFFTSICVNHDISNETKIRESLIHHKLTENVFIETYTVAYRIS